MTGERTLTIPQVDRFNRARSFVQATRMAVLGSNLDRCETAAVATIIDLALEDLNEVAVALGERVHREGDDDDV